MAAYKEDPRKKTENRKMFNQFIIVVSGVILRLLLMCGNRTKHAVCDFWFLELFEKHVSKFLTGASHHKNTIKIYSVQTSFAFICRPNHGGRNYVFSTPSNTYPFGCFRDEDLSYTSCCIGQMRRRTNTMTWSWWPRPQCQDGNHGSLLGG